MKISPKVVLIMLSSLAGAIFIVFILLAISQANLDALTKDPLVLFNVDAEVSIPTWYAQSLFLVAAGLLFLVGGTAKNNKSYWYALAGIMLFISIDEGASIHELLIVPMRELLNISHGPLYYTWVVVYGLLFAGIGLFFIRFFMRLPRKTRMLFVASLSLFLAGALGMEMLGAFVISQNQVANQLYAVIVGIEELLEMLGVIVFIYALLEYAQEQKQTELKIKLVQR